MFLEYHNIILCVWVLCWVYCCVHKCDWMFVCFTLKSVQSFFYVLLFVYNIFFFTIFPFFGFGFKLTYVWLLFKCYLKWQYCGSLYFCMTCVCVIISVFVVIIFVSFQFFFYTAFVVRDCLIPEIQSKQSTQTQTFCWHRTDKNA